MEKLQDSKIQIDEIDLEQF
jgi:hypothetical protein